MAAAQPPTPILDHIVVLVPHPTLLSLPPWLTDAFTVLPGGRHADGATENKLVLFRDGAYLELIAFVPGQGQDQDEDEGRRSHRWGRRREGHVVDWANTLAAEDDLEAVRRRVGSAAGAGGGIRYGDPVPGGRVRPDGVELRWVTSSPYLVDDDDSSSGDGGPRGFVGGEVPFWCLDRTARDLRVPYRAAAAAGEGDNARHPCGALGLAGVSVSVRDEGLFGMLKKTYDALQGREGTEREVPGAVKASSWSLQVPEASGVLEVQRTLTLALISRPGGESASAPPPDVYVELALVSSSHEGEVSGHLGDEEWLVKFDIQKA